MRRRIDPRCQAAKHPAHLVANGRACWTRSCARRSRDAATIFIALVICCVDLTARTRRLMSMSEGIRCQPYATAALPRRREAVADIPSAPGSDPP